MPGHGGSNADAGIDIGGGAKDPDAGAGSTSAGGDVGGDDDGDEDRPAPESPLTGKFFQLLIAFSCYWFLWHLTI